MRTIAIITVFMDTFCWFAGTISYLTKYLKHTTATASSDVSASSNLGLLIFMAILLALNIITLVYLFKKNEHQENGPKSSSNVKKIFIGIAWFAIIYFASCFMTGAILGVMVGASGTINQQADIAAVTHTFFMKYGTILLLGSILVAVIGTVKGWLPFTKSNEEI